MEKKGSEPCADYLPKVTLNKQGTEKDITLHQKYTITEASQLWKVIEQLIDELRKK